MYTPELAVVPHSQASQAEPCPQRRTIVFELLPRLPLTLGLGLEGESDHSDAIAIELPRVTQVRLEHGVTHLECFNRALMLSTLVVEGSDGTHVRGLVA